jgi:hypothetical protein
VLEDHLLVVAVALAGGPGADGLADHHVDLHLLALLEGQLEEVLARQEELQVLAVLDGAPLVAHPAVPLLPFPIRPFTAGFFGLRRGVLPRLRRLHELDFYIGA